jgi:hypothetical protein
MKKMNVQFIIMSFTISLITAAVSVFLVPEQVQALINTNQISDGAITTPKIADHSVTASKISGVTKLIFATCQINFGSVNPHADGLADCSVPGTATGDNVVATPNGMNDAYAFFEAISLDGKVRFLVHNNSDTITPPELTPWSLIVFHK